MRFVRVRCLHFISLPPVRALPCSRAPPASCLLSPSERLRCTPWAADKRDDCNCTHLVCSHLPLHQFGSAAELASNLAGVQLARWQMLLQLALAACQAKKVSRAPILRGATREARLQLSAKIRKSHANKAARCVRPLTIAAEDRTGLRSNCKALGDAICLAKVAPPKGK